MGKGMEGLQDLHRLVDKTRIAAKNAFNYVEHAMQFSHGFVPMIEGKYPCSGANHAALQAHRLHMKIGRAEASLGGSADGAGEAGGGALDILPALERRLAQHDGLSLGQLPSAAHQGLASTASLVLPFGPGSASQGLAPGDPLL